MLTYANKRENAGVVRYKGAMPLIDFQDKISNSN